MRVIPQKIHILRFIGEQGIVSVFDVARHLFQSEKSDVVRITMHQLGVAHRRYPGIRFGVWYIDKPQLYDTLRDYFPDLPRFSVRPVFHDQIPHYLELNHIRTTFEQSSKFIIEQWWSEQYIRSLEPEERFSFANTKIPDAIFWRKRHDGSLQKYFLEYERSSKDRERYEAILCSYSKRQDARSRNVIYICQTPYIRERLATIESKLARGGKLERAGICFQFITLEGFYNSYGLNQLKEGERNENARTMVETAAV
ncbi:MAG: hypothetical protein KGJ09_07320 [Candidatus Omnitrophica bacterium]|nr:hypothetical protein [Candidatus Omnitrophota bacterium]MDE2009872.1 hypothetical protein [Candidatus Omnitrophota bacterium]MDE2214346.1 hypothetical protein [Candidatus Omnitrophota bacterium]MDE2231095.1 hypothetical protein [Candidatus Omnitrophota bacterium]